MAWRSSPAQVYATRAHLAASPHGRSEHFRALFYGGALSQDCLGMQIVVIVVIISAFVQDGGLVGHCDSTAACPSDHLSPGMREASGVEEQIALPDVA
eukprot:2423558-Amphidinium_carterae.2